MCAFEKYSIFNYCDRSKYAQKIIEAVAKNVKYYSQSIGSCK